MRNQHFLKPNHKTETVRHLISVDTETQGGGDEDTGTPQELTVGWAHYSRRLPRGGWSAPRSHRFYDAGSLFDWIDTLLRPKERFIFLAHNWSFDAQVLGAFDALEGRGWDMGLGIIDGPPWAVSWKRGSTRLDMLDTMNWWPTKLARIGKSVGIEKGSWEGVKDSPKELSTYCYTDALIPLVAVQRWADWLVNEDLGGFSLTAASQAFRAFRHRFMSHPILIDNDEKALKLARQAFHGGRTECWQLGRTEGPLTLLDVNSIYPYVMAENDMPTVLRGRWKRVTLDELEAQMLDHCVIADVTITTDSPAYAVVKDGRLVFPVGTFRTTLTTPELRRALDRSELVCCHEAAFYDKAPIFEEYVEYFYTSRLEAKEEGNTFQSELFKLLMNSLYGKTGQTGMTWETIGDSVDRNATTWEVYDLDTNTRTSYRRLGGKIQEKHRDGESRESHPAIAAHVTALARLLIFELACVAGVENVHYMDTDSLLVNAQGLANLTDHIDPTRLGALKVEKTMPWAVLYGPKDYHFPHVTKIKGIRKDAHTLTEPEIRTWLHEKGRSPEEAPSLVGKVFRQTQFRSMVGALRAGEPGVMRIRQVVKCLRRDYRKGLPDRHGRVHPFRLGSGDPDSPPVPPTPPYVLPPGPRSPGSPLLRGLRRLADSVLAWAIGRPR